MPALCDHALRMIFLVAATAVLCLAPMLGSAPRAQDLPIAGVWTVRSLETKEVVAGKAVRPLGHVTGTFIFTRSGRFSGMVYSVDRKAPATANATEIERVALFNSMVAYSGTYQVVGNRLALTIENSHIQSWNGTERSFTVEIQGGRLTGRSSPLKAATTGLEVFAEFVWERIE